MTGLRSGVASLPGAAAFLLLATGPLAAQGADRAALVAGLCGDSQAVGAAAQALVPVAAGASDEDRLWAAPLAHAALDRKLTCDAAGAVLPVDGISLDALARTSRDATAEGRSPTLNLRNRALLETADAALTLRTAPDAGRRAVALRTLERRAATLPDGLLDAAAHEERDPVLRKQILAVGVAAALNSKDRAKRITALAQVADDPTGRALTSVDALKGDPAYSADPPFRQAVDAALAKINRGLAIGNALATLYNGLSFASILFMAAIGLAVIFGLMGVINLAQGEFIMIGAYATWLVQEGLQRFAPALVNYYLFLAIPVAFLAAAAVGVALEVTLLRHLYKRPLMSLLATWAVSLFLVNLVRVIFGTQNLQFVMPSYVTGGVPVIGDFIITWNRLFAIAFAAVTLALTFAVIRLTPCNYPPPCAGWISLIPLRDGPKRS